MNANTRNYLDNAATSWPKPESVYLAMDQFSREVGAAAGRGNYRAATMAGELVSSCRLKLRSLVNAPHAKQIAFFSNGTAALNAAIFGVIKQGDHVVTTVLEHNSVLRPLQSLTDRGVIRLTIVECNNAGQVDTERLLDAVDDKTSLVAVTHASNVTGAVQDVRAIGERLADHRALFLCDAAQTLGYLPLDMTECGIDLLASPGHKGTLGPLGTGMLAVSDKAVGRLLPTVFGGTGSISESLNMPDQLPEMLEAGNLNVPAIAGWNAALTYLQSLDPVQTVAHRQRLCARIGEKFDAFEGGFAVFGRDLPLASLVFDSLEPGLIANLLDSEFSIEVRSGLHCAALVHVHLENLRSRRASNEGKCQGTVRISAGHFTSLEQIDAAAEAVHDLINELSKTH